MIIGKNREQVIENIRKAAESGEFYAKVEPDDPILSAAESNHITCRYLSTRNTVGFKFKSFIARRIAEVATRIINRRTEIVGEENACDLSGGAIITSNHFGPLENTVIRHYVKKQGKKRLNVVSQVTNFAMSGFIGFLMNYADTVPLSPNFRYLNGEFIKVLGERLKKQEVVLIYPEQEMWFNYRKPRPLKRGAYHFAAKLNVPVVSCFVEMVDLPEKDAPSFYKVKYVLHILGTLYPDPAKSVKENSCDLCERDYALKKAAYEKAYGKPLDYGFENTDIAGWVGDTNEG